MASSSEVVKKVMRFKHQLTEPAESATVVKILRKLQDLDITLDILAETGIGKTVNSLRRHEQAGEFAKSLVKGWKRLIPKESTSHTEDVRTSESLTAGLQLGQHCPDNGCLISEDLNNNCLIYNKNHESSDEAVCKRKSPNNADSEKQCESEKKQQDVEEKGQKENESFPQSEFSEKEIEFKDDKKDDSVVSKKKKISLSDRKLSENKSSEETHQKSRSGSKNKIKSRSEKESTKKSKLSDETSNKGEESLSSTSNDKNSETSQQAPLRDYKYSEMYRDSEDRKKKRKRKEKEKHAGPKNEPESKHTEHKNKKMKRKNKDSEEPSMSFESYLNYDVNVCKTKEKSAGKKRQKKIKMAVKEEETEDLDTRADEMGANVTSPKQKFKMSVMDLLNIPLPAELPECDKPYCVEYFEKKVEKELDFYDEESAVFTGQRSNRKMQVYSGNKAVCLPTMMSLHQQCIRTLQNNINLLYETGGVPFDVLEPVLERCTPEQLLRIEECNPIYIGETDHLWGKHCQRDFKDSKLQEYESWKEMYMRLSEERERKLRRLTKSIVSAHSNKPKGRQVKMAFIHTVAKPPRDVRIQQEIHGTAVQQPQQPRSSVKVQDSRVRMSYEESSRSSGTGSGAGGSQDSRKKSKVAPMMAKSLKAFKKHLGRR
ncbi:LOW QUALITY PROTEIN: elongin A%2C like [Xyrichtys novacula]|uniref:LOW QUALITY PROTEIN: elongin A, like n=1 Tax=Xyrichtys novacula TaxID=13765 RepID=A0AAV1G2W1_XYRNO|nr:LOW QUALITY PROTEIN: elongin A%2C like [Xyrichtys novacula]